MRCVQAWVSNLLRTRGCKLTRGEAVELMKGRHHPVDHRLAAQAGLLDAQGIYPLLCAGMSLVGELFPADAQDLTSVRAALSLTALYSSPTL